ncbi:MAG: NAD-dependent epimerase/dehydratase family protein [Gammaproteobacteria bacterium]|nr:NAD-dependent epimerase/dehydratase family protein [Gammaproteobacteria bacterium]
MTVPEARSGTVLVTGGGGFIGSRLVRRLLEGGYAVRCLVRSEPEKSPLHHHSVELVKGDITRPDSLTAAVSGVDCVIHAAGMSWGSRAADFFRHNADGTQNLLRACVAAGGIRRFVYVSSQAAAGPAGPTRPAREDDPPRPLSVYGLSKLAAERHVAAFCAQLSTLIVRPSAVYGPGDRAFLQFFRLARRGFLVDFGTGERHLSLCYVDDLVGGLIASLDSQGPSGSVYFMADPEPYPWRAVEETVGGLLGVRARRITVPTSLFKAVGMIGQVYGVATGRPVLLNRLRAADLLEHDWCCDVSSAQRKLGYAPEINLLEGLRNAVRWYQENNLL